MTISQILANEVKIGYSVVTNLALNTIKIVEDIGEQPDRIHLWFEDGSWMDCPVDEEVDVVLSDIDY